MFPDNPGCILPLRFDAADGGVVLDRDILHPLDVSHIVGMPVFVDGIHRDCENATINSVGRSHRYGVLKRRFTFFDKCFDPFLAVGMRGAIADPSAFPLQLLFQGHVK